MEKVLAGEYIDFAKLPPAKGKVKSIPNTVEGQIVVVQTADLLETRKLIPDLATWVQCFGIYAAIITSKDPTCMKNMFVYLTLIAKCSQKYRWSSWVVYDQNFWQEAAEIGQKDWSKVDPSIYAQCFTGASISQENWCKHCHSIDHVSDTCPIKPYAASRKREGPLQASAAPPKKRPAPRSNPAVCRSSTCTMWTASLGKCACSNTNAKIVGNTATRYLGVPSPRKAVFRSLLAHTH